MVLAAAKKILSFFVISYPFRSTKQKISNFALAYSLSSYIEPMRIGFSFMRYCTHLLISTMTDACT